MSISPADQKVRIKICWIFVLIYMVYGSLTSQIFIVLSNTKWPLMSLACDCETTAPELESDL